MHKSTKMQRIQGFPATMCTCTRAPHYTQLIISYFTFILLSIFFLRNNMPVILNVCLCVCV